MGVGIHNGEASIGSVGGDAKRPGLLILNAGSVHNIGPNRMWVKLAREWAARGIVVLRLDISGIGDSPPHAGHADNVVYSSTVADDVRLALGYMRARHGVGECHVLGLCSGAFQAFRAAVDGEGIASAVMINPLTFFWHEGDVMLDDKLRDDDVIEATARYKNVIFTREPWLKLLRGQLNWRIILRTVYRRFAAELQYSLKELSRLAGISFSEDLAVDLATTAHHGIRMRFVFSTTSPGLALLRQQGGRMVSKLIERGDISIDLIPDTDHTFTELAGRERLFTVLNQIVFPHEQTR